MIKRELKTVGFYFFAVVLAGIFIIVPARGEDPFGLRRDGSWQIEADRIDYEKDQQVYNASGKVVVIGEEQRIEADEIRFDQARQIVTASGNVTLTSGEDLLTGDRLSFDLQTKEGKIDQGRIFIKERGFHISGRNIEKVGSDSYRADYVSLTTCDPDDPDWHITGHDLKVTVEGYGSLRRAAFWAGRVPAVYTPYFFFPVKIKRQTGFLVPEISYSSRTWESWEQPFFWAISDSADMTLTAHHLGRRGQKLGLEYRQVFSPVSKFTFMFDFLDDRKTNQRAGDEFSFGRPDLLRPNNYRYWLRMKQDQHLGGGVMARLDMDIVSDQDYLREFKSGYTGYRKTDQYFESQFGRDLEDYNRHVRTNRLNIHKSWAGLYGFNTTFRWLDDVVKRRWSDEDNTAQRLPEIRFNALKQPLRYTPLYYDFGSEYVYCYRQDGTRGHRTDFNPRVYLPLKGGNVFFLEPSLGFRETTWWVDTFDDDNLQDADKSMSRSLYDVRVDLSSELYRVFLFDHETSAACKHTLIPEVVYEYIPEVDQEGLPVFDDQLDFIEEKNLVTYSLTNTFTLRRPRPAVLSDGLSGSASPADFRYRQVFRFKVSQQYDINEAREKNPAEWVDPAEKQPFSPVKMEMSLNPSPSLRLKAEAGWHVYDDQWAYYNARTRWQSRHDHKIDVEYRYVRDRFESVVMDLELALTSHFTAYFSHERNLYDRLDIKSGMGAIYRSGCWALDVGYTDELDDRRYAFVIHLTGLGEIGTDFTGRSVEEPW